MIQFDFAPAVTSTVNPLMLRLEMANAWLESISAGGWAWVGIAFHTMLTVFMIIRILSKQRNTGIAIAWLVLIFAIPFFSILVYILIGEPYLGKSYKARNSKAQKMLDSVAKRDLYDLEKADHKLPERYQGVSRIGTVDTGFGVYDNHSMALLTSSDSTFDRLIQDIEQADKVILMEFYIIYPKGRVREVFQALIDASNRGVECQILADSVGSFSLFTDDWHEKLLAAGILVHQSLPVGLFKTLFKRTDLRNHRKIVVIDDYLGYTGSFNLVDPKFFKQEKTFGKWIDLVLRIESQTSVSVVTALSAVNITDIGAENSENLKVLRQRIDENITTYTRKFYRRKPAINDVNDKAARYLFKHIAAKNMNAEYGRKYAPTITPTPETISTSDYLYNIAHLPIVEDVLAQLIPSAPSITDQVIYNTLLTVFHRANERIQITTPYFVPDEALLSALTTAAKRGVEVTLILPKAVDSYLVQHASQASYAILMEAGVKIALFKGGLLHAKTVVIDDDYCLFGTVNMDMRSFYLNMEVSLALYTPEIVAQVVECQQAYLTQCDIVDLAEWECRPTYKKLFDSGIRLFSPLL